VVALVAERDDEERTLPRRPTRVVRDDRLEPVLGFAETDVAPLVAIPTETILPHDDETPDGSTAVIGVEIYDHATARRFSSIVDEPEDVELEWGDAASDRPRRHPDPIDPVVPEPEVTTDASFEMPHSVMERLRATAAGITSRHDVEPQRERGEATESRRRNESQRPRRESEAARRSTRSFGSNPRRTEPTLSELLEAPRATGEVPTVDRSEAVLRLNERSTRSVIATPMPTIERVEVGFELPNVTADTSGIPREVAERLRAKVDEFVAEAQAAMAEQEVASPVAPGKRSGKRRAKTPATDKATATAKKKSAPRSAPAVAGPDVAPDVVQGTAKVAKQGKRARKPQSDAPTLFDVVDPGADTHS
jgi:hypothetical protein